MSMIRAAVERELRKQLPSTDAPRAWRNFFSAGLATASSVEINEDTAVGIPAVYSCVRVLAESVGQIPFMLYRRLAPRGKQRATDLPLFSLLHSLPNEEMTSVELREWMVASLALRGNSTCFIERTRGGDPRSLWPLQWANMTPVRSAQTGQVRWHYNPPNAEPVWLDASQVWHVRLFGGNPIIGSSPIALAREALGAAAAVQEYGARFFAEGAAPMGVLQHPKELSDEAHKRLSVGWNAAHQGLSNAHKVAVLEEGMEWNAIGIAPEDAQLIETKKFSRSEIAGIFRVPAHLINDLEKATFSNVEHLDLGLVKHSLMPYLVKIEQSVTRCLIPPAQRGELFAAFVVNGLLRGDSKSRSEFYKSMWEIGALSRNEIRELEDMNPTEDGTGETYFVPLNFIPADQAEEYYAAGGQPPQLPALASAARNQLRSRDPRREVRARTDAAEEFRPAFEAVLAQITRAEERDVMAAVRRAVGGRAQVDVQHVIESFYREGGGFRSWVDERMQPAFRALSAAIDQLAAREVGGAPMTRDDVARWAAELARTFAERHAKSSTGQLLKITREAAGAELEEILAEKFGVWKAERPARVAARETVKASRATARASFERGGVERLRWVTSGDNCPYCQGLDGKIVGIREHFVAKGEALASDGHESLVVKQSIGHPPVHPGCDCDIVPD